MMRRYCALCCALMMAATGCSKKPDEAPAENKLEAAPTDVNARLASGPHASAKSYCEASGLAECEPDLVNARQVDVDSIGETVATAAVIARTEDGASWQRIALIGKPGNLYEVGVAQTWREEEGAEPYTTLSLANTEFAPEGFFIAESVAGIERPAEGDDKRYDFTRTAHVCAFVSEGLACAEFVTEAGFSFAESSDGQIAAMVLQAKEGSAEPVITATEVLRDKPAGVDLDMLVKEGTYRIVLP